LLFSNNIKNSAKLWFTTIICLVLLPAISVAQFVVKNNSILTLNHPVYSLEQNNAFQSFVTGDAILHFNGNLQTLTTSKDAYLTNVTIDSATKLHIINKITIKGNLDIVSGVLVLEYPLIIGGKFTVLNTAAVQNAYLITFEQHNIEQTNSILAYSSQVTPFFANSNKKQEGLKYVKNIKKVTAMYYVIDSYRCYVAAPTTPPPENS
jgi:hypothetical protein